MIGQMNSALEGFRSRFGRHPSAGEFYLLGRHGLDSVSGMMANPQLPAWVSAYQANRASGATPEWARSQVWNSLPAPVQRWFPQGANAMTGDSYLGIHSQVPYSTPGAGATGGPMPDWAGLLGGNALNATRLPDPGAGGQGQGQVQGASSYAAPQPSGQLPGPPGSGMAPGSGASIWPWAQGTAASQSPVAGSGLSGALGNWNGSAGQNAGMGSSGNALSQIMYR